jgi:predicted MPP superfamily phosphohydrolase
VRPAEKRQGRRQSAQRSTACYVPRQPVSVFFLASVAATVAVVAIAALLRSRAYAVFRGVTLGLHTLIASALLPQFSSVLPVFVFLHVTVYVSALALIRPRLHGLAYRVLVSLPAAFFSAGTLLAFPWAIAGSLGFEPWAPWLPYAVAFVGLLQSLSSREEEVDVVVADGHSVDGLRRVRRGEARTARPLRIVQITDPHLGPFMSVRRLQRICDRAVARQPDLVVLTGDFLTMESQRDPAYLSAALDPLKALSGRTFACLGNHDHEALDTVQNALRSAGVRLLVDRAVEVDTLAGPVQLVGMDFSWRNRTTHLKSVCARYPRRPGALRLVLLHDPGAFKRMPAGEADLVLSGHTHGGQVGLVSLGLPWTMLRVLMNAPDHGFWARGTDRLYVHRGTGHYGFPLRLGVPGEQSLLRVHALRDAHVVPLAPPGDAS